MLLKRCAVTVRPVGWAADEMPRNLYDLAKAVVNNVASSKALTAFDFFVYELRLSMGYASRYLARCSPARLLIGDILV